MRSAAFLTLVGACAALDNGAALTPPIGWSTWNHLKCKFDADVLLQTAQQMVDSGMVAAGYRTLNIDDCWPLKTRDADGNIVPDPTKFPDGFGAFADKLRAIGVGLGIYTSHGNLTCQSYPGSYGHEERDAAQYAKWGVEFVKDDWCSNRPGKPAVPDLEAFDAMRDALNRTGKPITYSIHWNYKNTKGPTCEQGVSCPLPATANMWRIGGDIGPKWSSVLGLIDIDTPLAANAGPGRWNDADMMEAADH
jgi:alpha-galactosidase